jgi:hypothetical protein
MVEACKDNEQVSIIFNGQTIVANKTSTTESIVADYFTQSDAAAERYSDSLEGKKAAEEAQQHVERLQSLYDASLAELPSLNFEDQAGLLAWFEKVQEASDHSGVHGRAEGSARIVDVFTENGYLSEANLGDACNENDADNVARFIIGQCLSFLTRLNLVHQVIHSFADEWRNKFQPKAA